MGNNVVILAGGQGKRMKTERPKVLCNVLGEPMLEWVVSACESAGLDDICVVKGYAGEYIDEYIAARQGGAKLTSVLQAERLGTGHAVMQAADHLRQQGSGNTLILCGDAPFIDKETILGALELHEKEKNAVTVVTSEIADPTGYGRIIRTPDGISGIVEHKDCTPEQLGIREINSGCYWFDTEALLEVLFSIKPNNAQGEYYLTDCLELLIKAGKRANAFTSRNPDVSMGANDRKGLLRLNDLARMAVIDRLLDEGVEFTCTDGVIIERSVTVGKGTVIGPNVQLRGATAIGEDCMIRTGCILSNTTVGNGTDLNYVQAYDSRIGNKVKIGPFVQLRPGSNVLDGAKIGDFVEIKNSAIGEGTAVAHLTYVGDSDVGANVNFGCGVVTVNFDGENKFRTTIKDNAFIGCNTNLIAPVTVGEGAFTAAGTTVTRDVPDWALAIDRGQLTFREGYSKTKLAKRTKKFQDANKASQD